MLRSACLSALFLLGASCGRSPGAYPPPPQLPSDMGPDPRPLGAFITMNDPAASDYVVRDISAEPGLRRWAFLHPEMRFVVQDTRNLKFGMEFLIPEVTFRDTGPVTVSCAIDGKRLGSIRCDHAGPYRFEKPVPPGWVHAEREAHVAIEVDRRWVSRDDGAQLSLLLQSAGFTQ